MTDIIYAKPRNESKFFSQTKCDRCGNYLDTGRIMSWFNEDTICMKCSDKEDEIKQRIRSENIDPDIFEGYGEIPSQFIEGT